MRRYALDIGRILLSLIFLGSAATKLADPAGTQAYMAAYGLPMTGVLLVPAIATELLGGLALLLGLKTRLAAFVLAGFLATATLIFHTSLGEQQQLFHFFKNVSILGGLLHVMSEGAGPLSLDQRLVPSTDGRMEGTAADPVAGWALGLPFALTLIGQLFAMQSMRPSFIIGLFVFVVPYP